MKFKATFLSTVFWLTAVLAWASPSRVSILRTPHEGLQPQAAIDEKGVLHLIYYKGDPAGGDLFYVRRPPGQGSFSEPIRVNHQSGSAIAMGTIRGGQLALGKNGRVHVVWNGMGNGAEKVVIDGRRSAPLLYTRLDEKGTGFEMERNVITYAAGLDGGSSIAADPQGHVYVTWHAPLRGNTNEEAGRAVFLASSSDEGRTFGGETPALPTRLGACPCCGMRAFADRFGAIYILFRGASDDVNRDGLVLRAPAPGAEFVVVKRDPWKISTCPMSSATLTETATGVLGAWETAGQIHSAVFDRAQSKLSPLFSPRGTAVRKHPAVAANKDGELLLVWTEGTRWGKGGSVAWQVFTSAGKPTAQMGRAEGLPPWSMATACTLENGEFLIVY